MPLIASAILIISLPIAGFFMEGLFGNRLPRKGDWLATGIMGIVLGLSLWVFFQVFNVNSPDAGARGSAAWFSMAGDGAYLFAGLMIDNLTAMMLVVVSVVSFLVHLYSVGYMHGDPKYVRYYAGLQLFSAAMLGLVLSDNLLTLYISWEIMGFCSYLLIGHYFEKKSAADACLKAFMTTRVGDVLMFLGILIIFWRVGSLRYADIFAAVASGTLSGSWQVWAGLLLFGGAIGKSAQFPLHVWLPDAMEGPTPVSALIHAATMVAAGVYLMARMYLLLTPEVFLSMAYIGGFTAIFAATIGVVMDDIKKVLAYSTISQLGYMMLGLGVGGFVLTGYTAGVYHLTTHAFFKACLFLGSGSVIHALHTQSMSEMGGLRKKMPVTFVTFLIATLALTGMPPFSGYFTKDSIIASAIELGMRQPRHWALAGFAVLAAFFTAFYMFRLIFLTFFGQPRNHDAHRHAHESGWVMALPLIILAMVSIYPIGGGHVNWFWSSNPSPAQASITNHYSPMSHNPSDMDTAPHAKQPDHDITTLRRMNNPKHETDGTQNDEHLAHAAHNAAVTVSLAVLALGIAFAWLTYIRRAIRAEDVARRFAVIHRILLNKYYIDEFYMAFVVRPFLKLSAFMGGFDKWIIDGLVNLTGILTRALGWLVGLHDRVVVDGAVNAVADSAMAAGRAASRLQTGRVSNYLMGILLGMVFLAGFAFWILGRTG
ncbi:MAG: NADH-quinone oxidoreductase subunit L [bacterium]